MWKSSVGSRGKIAHGKTSSAIRRADRRPTINDWRRQLTYDPLPPLLESSDEALRTLARRDLLGESRDCPETLWQLPQALRLIKKQQSDGSWLPRTPAKHPAVNHKLIETWRQFRFLVDQFGMTRDHPPAAEAAEYLFSCQTEAGDFRGILANQYATYYTGAIMATLIRAGYQDDPRIERGFGWLLEMRQDDGGWSVPMITHKLDRATQFRLTTTFMAPVEPDRTKPFSHNWTGMVLRAFAEHPVQRASAAALKAGRLLKSRFFEPDAYTSMQAASYWVRFGYPFWWNNLVAALDSLTLMGFTADDPPIHQGMAWLVDHQESSGLWKVSYVDPQAKEKQTPKARQAKLWVTLAIARLFARLYG